MTVKVSLRIPKDSQCCTLYDSKDIKNATLLPGMSISKTDSSCVYTVVYVNVSSRLCILMQNLDHVFRAWNQETRITATMQV